jgi:hypothetical protein
VAGVVLAALSTAAPAAGAPLVAAAGDIACDPNHYRKRSPLSRLRATLDRREGVCLVVPARLPLSGLAAVAGLGEEGHDDLALLLRARLNSAHSRELVDLRSEP